MTSAEAIDMDPGARGRSGAGRSAMKELFGGFPDRMIGPWDCTGPQTGFAECTYGNRRITARF